MNEKERKEVLDNVLTYLIVVLSLDTVQQAVFPCTLCTACQYLTAF